MSRFLDSRYKALSPYTPGEQPQQRKYIKLNTNESPFPPSPEVIEAVCNESKKLNLYSDPECGIFLNKFSDYLNVKSDQVFASNGSDEVLAIIFQALTENGVAFSDITYGFYPVYTRLYEVDTKIIPLREDFTIEPADYFDLKRTIIIANPNAPTGIALGCDEIELILKRNRDSLVVIDEAYVEFGAQTTLPLLNKYDNLLIVGTFSKSRSLAGARLGYAVANKELIADLNRIKFSINPYNVNRMTLVAGAAALNDDRYFRETRDKIITNREYFLAQIKTMGFRFTDSKANFIFTKHEKLDGRTIYRELREKGILVRWFDKERIKDWLRITIGNIDDMKAVIDALREITERQSKDEKSTNKEKDNRNGYIADTESGR